MNPREPVAVHDVEYPTEACARCEMCNLWCQPVRDDPTRCNLPDWFGNWRKPIRRGEYLFRAGESFHSIYALRNGSLKEVQSGLGGEIISDFRFAGELVGLDAIHSGRHRYSAVALEDGHVCEVPFDQLERLCLDRSNSQLWLHKTMSLDDIGSYLGMTAEAIRQIPYFQVDLRQSRPDRTGRCRRTASCGQ